MSFNSPFWQKRVFQLVVATSALFVLLTAVAMLIYPGGSVHNPDQVGYAFLSNFFSDLGLTQAHNGQANWLSAGLFFIALSGAGAGLILFFIAFPQFFRGTRLGWWLSLLGSTIGVVAGISFIGIAFTPADLWRQAHIWFVLYAFQGLLIAALFYGAAILYDRSYPRWLGAIFGLFILLLAGYVALLRGGPPPSTPEGAAIQVAGQKIIAYAAVFTIMIQAWGANNLLKR
jgi:hypothetical protein